jgi:predicted TIM-barrel enzyme
MAFQPGYKSAFYLANSAAALQNLSPYADSVSVPQSVQTLETSTFGTVSKSFVVGLSDGDAISVSGPYDVTVHTQLTALKAAQAAGSAAAAYIWGPGGSVASQARSAGSAFVTSYNVSSGVGGRVEYTATLQVTGAVTNSTF